MNRTAVVCLLAGLIVGALVGWVLAPAAQDATVKPDTDEAAPTARDLPQPRKPSPKQESAPNPVAQSTETAPDVAALPASLTMEVPTGDGAITGTVTLADNAPLAGVEIRATPHVGETELPPDASLEQEVRAHARRVAGTVIARTDAGGGYRLSGLPEGSYYRLEARLDGYTFHIVGGAPGGWYRPGSLVNFRAKAVVWVKADVRMADGSAAEIAHIGVSENVDHPRSTNYWLWSPDKPTRAFEPGDWRLTPRGGVDNEASAEPFSITVVAGEPHDALIIRLHVQPGIVGQVHASFPNGYNAQVRVNLLKQGAEGYVDAYAGSRRSGDRSRHVGGLYDGKVQFRFMDLEAGAYRIAVSVMGDEVLTHDVSVTDKIERVELTAPEPDATAYLVVRVTGPDGPLEDVRFNLYSYSGGSGGGGSADAMNRGGGVYWIPRTELRKREGRTYTHTLIAVSQSLGSREKVIDAESGKVIEFSFAAPAFVTVKVSGLDNHPKAADIFAEVNLVGARRDRHSMFRRRLDDGKEAGARRHGPLVPGEYLVELLYGPRGASEPYTFDRKTVVLSSGDDITVELNVPTLHSFTVVIPRQHRGSQLHLRNVADPDYHRMQGQPGAEEHVFEGLIPGTYELSDHSTGAMLIVLPQSSGARIQFAPVPFNAVRLVQVFRSSHGKSISVKPGDIVVSVDGTAVTDLEHFYKLLAEVLKGEESTWIVERDGARVSATFKTADWNDSRLRGEAALRN